MGCPCVDPQVDAELTGYCSFEYSVYNYGNITQVTLDHISIMQYNAIASIMQFRDIKQNRA